ncbi:MAG: hypothetical protein AVDCRST_MAG67-58, partial [uncultured Solirubrobacteraceae bacterium]
GEDRRGGRYRSCHPGRSGRGGGGDRAVDRVRDALRRDRRDRPHRRDRAVVPAGRSQLRRLRPHAPHQRARSVPRHL